MGVNRHAHVNTWASCADRHVVHIGHVVHVVHVAGGHGAHHVHPGVHVLHHLHLSHPTHPVHMVHAVHVHVVHLAHVVVPHPIAVGELHRLHLKQKLCQLSATVLLYMASTRNIKGIFI